MNLSLERQPIMEAEPADCFDPKRRPVDLTHLSRFTMGNSAVEREVLELFRRQTRLYFDKLSEATSDDAWRAAARVLTASARSVGAWQLLRTAEAMETLAVSAPASARGELLGILAKQIDEANLFIQEIL